MYVIEAIAHSARVCENGEIGASASLELIEIFHQLDGLHCSHAAVVGALQLVTKVDHLGGHVCYPVLQHLELRERLLDGEREGEMRGGEEREGCQYCIWYSCPT